MEPLVHQAKRAALLAYLAAATPRGLHRRDKLLALFWPELDQARARAALNQAVYVLRATLGEDALMPRGDGALGLHDTVWCDAAAFEAALDAGRPADAMALYRGDLLDGFFISDAPEFERWLDGERARLRQRACEGAWALAEAEAAEGDVLDAERWASRAGELAPADEAVIRRLINFLHGLGDRAAAIRVYESYVSRLKKEYELEPSAETEALAATIRQEESAVPALRSLELRPAPLRRRFPAGRLTAAAAAVAALAGAWAWLRSRELQPSVVRFTLEFPAEHKLPPAVGGPRIALSPDGSQLVYLARGPEGNQLFLRPIDRVDAVPIPHTHGANLGFFSPDGEWLGFVIANTISKVPVRGGPAIVVCKVATAVGAASWGPNGVIVFATPAGLWRVPSGGGTAQPVALADTARGERYRLPDFLPGGRAVVFTTAGSAGFHLAAVSLETGAVVPLGVEGTNPHFITPGYLLFARTDGVLLAAPFDPNGLRVTGPAFPVAEGVLVGPGGAAKLGVSSAGAFAYVPEPDANHSLALVDRAGNAVTVPLSPRGFGAVRFSPDGRRIATVVQPAHGRADVWVLDLDANTFRRVTSDGGNLAPVWGPDGQRIAFATNPGGPQYGWAVRWASVDASDSAETLLPAQIGQIPEAFTPDGRMLLGQRKEPATGWDVWTLSFQGERRLRPYLNGRFDEHSVALSPDGRWLAYVSNESGQDEVYVRAFAASGSPEQVSSGGGREPRWSRGGRELFYRNSQGMIGVALHTSRPFRVGRHQVLFDDTPYVAYGVGAAYDVHPDGRRFLMIRRGPQQPQVVVVLNWFAQRRLGAPK